MHVDVIIPALDEAAAIGQVVQAIPCPPVRDIIVVDNGSRDATAQTAAAAGARVINEPRRGYGSACLAGIATLQPDVDIVVFLDADGSDDPTQLPNLLSPIERGDAQLVVGSRTLGINEPGALTMQQRIGNAIASAWLRRRFHLQATDLGPFRAIRADSLRALKMVDRGYGWTVEMQIKAARLGLDYAEIPATYRKRLGRSKVSGTLRGVLGATYKILGLLAYYDLAQPSEIAGQKSSSR
ncbi:MAG: glycosyltransferase family 2 protein [Myxococcota bacterium]